MREDSDEDGFGSRMSVKAKNKIHELEQQLNQMINDNRSLSSRVEQLQNDEV